MAAGTTITSGHSRGVVTAKSFIKRKSASNAVVFSTAGSPEMGLKEAEEIPIVCRMLRARHPLQRAEKAAKVALEDTANKVRRALETPHFARISGV